MRCRSYRWLWGLLPLALIALLALLGERPRIEADLKARAQTALEEAGLGWVGAEFSGRDALMTGIAEDETEHRLAYDVVVNTWGVRTVDNETALVAEVSPYTWSASREDNRIKLKGYVSSEQMRRSVIGIARASFPGFTIDDKTEIARGVPDKEQWLGAISYGLNQLGKLSEGSVRLDDREFSIQGEAVSATAYDEVVSALKRLPAGFTLGRQNIAPPVADPYLLKARFDGRKLVLEGYVPDERTRSTLLDEARLSFRGAQIEERLHLASGAPRSYADAASHIFAQLARLNRGNAVLTGTSLDFSGEAKTEDDAEAIAGALRSGLPAGYTSRERVTFVQARVPTVKPYIWDADLLNGRLVISGYVPGEDARRTVLDTIKRRLPGVTVEDRMQIAVGGPDAGSWLAGIGYALERLAGLKGGHASINERSISITGEAADTDSYRLVLEALATPPNGFEIRERNIDPPSVETYTWSIDAEDERRIVLEGYVPSEQARDSILAEVRKRFKGRDVVDRMAVAKGIPGSERDWLLAVEIGIRASSQVGNGRAVLRDSELNVTGGTDAAELPEEVAQMVRKSLPRTFSGDTRVIYRGPSPEELEAQRLAEEEAKRKEEERKRLAEEEERKRLAEEEERKRLAAEEEARRQQEAALATVKPYVFVVRYDGISVELTGSVPSEDAKRRIAADVRKKFPNRRIVDRTRVARGEPAGFEAAVSEGLGQLSRLEDGDFSLYDNSAVLSGTADSESRREEARRAMRSRLPGGFFGNDRVVYKAPPEPSAEDIAKNEERQRKADQVDVEQVIAANKAIDSEQCQAAFTNVTRRGKAFFGVDSAELDSKSKKLLDKLVKVVKLCPDVRIEIAGHTDSDGSAAYNQKLSEERANAVVAYLTAKGIDAARLSPVGHGEERPLARNTTAANKAKNRRIEFEIYTN